MSQYGVFSDPYFPAFGLNTDQKQLCIWTLFTQWTFYRNRRTLLICWYGNFIKSTLLVYGKFDICLYDCHFFIWIVSSQSLSFTYTALKICEWGAFPVLCFQLCSGWIRLSVLENKNKHIEPEYRKRTRETTKIYLFKVKNRHTRKRREVCSKLTIKTPLLLSFWCF